MTSPSMPSRQRKSSPNPKAAQEGDHRKKPRNRTTQSCLNCHTSKRMCDRKRPACSRCIQLGLTGLCVYEVDDPHQKATAGGDGSTRLLKRIAELEEVIRELKNKPNPRWLQGSNFSKSNTPEARTSTPESEAIPRSTPNSSSPSASSPNPEFGIVDIPSGLVTFGAFPTSDLANPPASPDEQRAPDFSFSLSTYGPEYNFVSAFQDPAIGWNPATAYKQLLCGHPNFSHCGCMQDPVSYQTMLELSLRLRKATDILGQSPTHRPGEGFCELHQRILELDLLAMNTLGSPIFCHSHMAPQTINQSLPSHQRPWDFLAGDTSPTSEDSSESFMSWRPLRS